MRAGVLRIADGYDEHTFLGRCTNKPQNIQYGYAPKACEVLRNQPTVAADVVSGKLWIGIGTLAHSQNVRMLCQQRARVERQKRDATHVGQTAKSLHVVAGQ